MIKIKNIRQIIKNKNWVGINWLSFPAYDLQHNHICYFSITNELFNNIVFINDNNFIQINTIKRYRFLKK